MARRRITQARITHISLVPRGANRLPVIFKADDRTLDLDMLVKADNIEQGELTAIVYAPEVRDSQGDIASAGVIKQMMYDAARDGVSIDIRHDGVALPKTKAFVAESFIVQKGDPRFEGMKTYDGHPVDPTGSWGVVLKVEDPELRKQYREGKWNGVSMAGTAVVEADKSDDLIERATSLLEKLLGTDDSTGDIDMKPEELTKALADNNAALTTAIVAGLTAGIEKAIKEAVKATATEEKDKKDDKQEKQEKEDKKRKGPMPPIFKGNPLSTEDIAAHQRNLALFELRKEVDWTDPESLNEYVNKLTEFQQEFGEFTEAELKSMNKGSTGARPSNQPAANRDSEDGNAPYIEGMSKEDTDLLKMGSRMAQWSNAQRGFTTAKS